MSADVSILLAVQHSSSNVPTFLDRVRPADCPEVEVLICSAGPIDLTGQPGNVRLIEAPRDALIPELWAIGFEAANAPLVATTTAHCLPDEQWVDRLLKSRLDRIAAIGGSIAADPEEPDHARAIYNMRYLSFAPTCPAGRVEEVAADNSVYRRDAVSRHADLLSIGFWEPQFHTRFRQEGLDLVMDPGLRVTHANRYSAAQFARQRFAHGKAFGRARVSDAPMGRRVLLAFAAPLLPAVFLSRILSRIHKARSRMALPHLLVYVLAWGAGEALAYWRALLPTR